MKTIRSFKYAIRGVLLLFKEEQNARVEALIGAVAIALGFGFHIAPTEWMIVVLCIASVLGAEAFNSAIETLCDKVQPEQDPVIARIKDISAGAVLIIAAGSAVISLQLFLPYMIN